MFQIGDIVQMAPNGGSYISTMITNFRANPEARIVDIYNRDGKREYRVEDYLGNHWSVVEKEIIRLIKSRDPILFI